MRIKVLWFCVLLILGFTSCDSNHLFDTYTSVPNQWHKDSIIEFQVNPLDTISAFNLFINIRNNNNYKYSNLFLIVEMNYPNGKTVKDTLEYAMAKPNGELLGKGFSDVKENKLWYKEGVFFLENGNYNIKIQHAMRKNGTIRGIENLQGITEVGFRVEKQINK